MNAELEIRLKEAVSRFWSSRETQAQKQGTKSGVRDAGSRAAVTGGSQMDGFVELVRDLLEESGVDKPVIYCERCVELPGWFRPEKKWDLLVVVDGCLIAAIEFKSQVGSFGNNYNNRTEEAIGSATDLWAAYREGAFKPSAMARISNAIGGSFGFDPPSKGSRAAFQSLRGVSARFLREALRDPPDKTGARKTLRFSLLPNVQQY